MGSEHTAVSHIEPPNSCSLSPILRDDGRWFTAGCLRRHSFSRPLQIGVVISESDILSCAAHCSFIRLHTSRARQPFFHLLSAQKRAHKPMHLVLPDLLVTSLHNYGSYFHSFLVLQYPRLSLRRHSRARISRQLFLLGDCLHPVFPSPRDSRIRALVKIVRHFRTTRTCRRVCPRGSSPRGPRPLRDWPRVLHTFRLCKTYMPRRVVPSARSWANYSPRSTPRQAPDRFPRRQLPAADTRVPGTRARPRISHRPP